MSEDEILETEIETRFYDYQVNEFQDEIGLRGFRVEEQDEQYRRGNRILIGSAAVAVGLFMAVILPMLHTERARVAAPIITDRPEIRDDVTRTIAQPVDPVDPGFIIDLDPLAADEPDPTEHGPHTWRAGNQPYAKNISPASKLLGKPFPA